MNGSRLMLGLALISAVAVGHVTATVTTLVGTPVLLADGRQRATGSAVGPGTRSLRASVQAGPPDRLRCRIPDQDRPMDPKAGRFCA
jgi:hypothetical protein